MARIFSHKRSVTKVNVDVRAFLSLTKPEVEYLSLLSLGKKDSEYNQAELSAALITQRGKVILDYGEPLAPTFYDEVLGKYANEDDADCQEHVKIVLDMIELLSEVRGVLNVMERTSIICDRGKKENQEKRSNTQPAIAAPSPGQITVKQPSPIPSFTGKIEDWPLYWSIFNANINKDITLTKCEKMQRLLVGLHGEAQHVVQGLLVNDENYQIAIDWLKTKYENSTEVNKTLTEKLLSSTPKSSQIEDQKVFLGSIKTTIAQLNENNAAPHPAVITCSIIPKFSNQVQLCMADRLADQPDAEKDLTSLLKMLTIAVDSAERRSKVSNSQRQASLHDKEMKHVNTVIKQPKTVPTKPAKPYGFSCAYCGSNHRSWSCTTVKDIATRIAILQRESRCMRCTGKSHDISTCKASSCFYCHNPNHHSSICTDQQKSKTTNDNSGKDKEKGKYSYQQHDNKNKRKFIPGKTQRPTAKVANAVATQQQGTVITNNVISDGAAKVLLPIAQATTFDSVLDKPREVHLLMDSGSDTTFITRSLATQLRLKSIGTETRTVKPFNTEPTTKVHQIYEIILTDKRGKPYIIQAIETETITGKVPNIALTEKDRQFLKAEQISLSVSENYSCTDPQILIGSDIFDTFVSAQEIKKALPQGTALMKTTFGYIPYGPAQIQGVNWTEELSTINMIKTYAVNTQQIPEFTPDNQEFTGPTAEEKRQISEQVWKELEETIQEERQADGSIRYAVKLPWIPTQERLPTNRAIAKRRLENLYKTSKAIEGRLEQIDTYFEEQLELGILEVVNENKPASGSRVHYLPNMPVLRPDNKTHPLRMVMDASAHYKNEPCLNDLLYPGPLLLPNLAGNLLRFRTGKFALIADIEKAFLQVRLQSCDRDASRTLWVKDLSKPPTEDNLLVLRHTTVLFGLNCAPFLLAATIVHHAKHSNQLSEELRRELLVNTYVDNVLCCAETQEEILRKYHELKEFFGSMKMNLRSFSSNANLAMEEMAEADKEPDQIVKILGLYWDTVTDTMKLHPCNLPYPVTTKAEVSAVLGSSFDPLGLMVPILLPAKSFLQKMWEKDLDWNDDMSPEMQKSWDELWQQIETNSIIIPRQAANVNPVEASELIIYADSSESAMGCCVYLQQNDQRDLIMGKSKLLNKRIVFTIPKAELSALTMSCLAAKFVHDQLKHSITIKQIFIFADNQVVLSWLQQPPPHSEGAFVRNRLREIKAIISMLTADNIAVRFGYVPTNENIADTCTKNNYRTIWSQEMWLKGPQQFDSVARNRKLFELKDNEGEEGIPDYAQVNVVTQSKDSLLNLTDFSSFKKAVSTVATVIRFFKRVIAKWPERRRKDFLKKHPKFKLIPASKWLTIAEVQEAKQRLLVAHQKEEATQAEIMKIKLNNQVEKQVDGIYRVISRLHNSDLPASTKEAVIVRSNSRLAELIIWQIHNEYHKPISQVVAEICREYYIKAIKNLAGNTVRKCVRCKRFTGLPYKYPTMTDLPVRRVKECRPFGHVGLDYFGPIYVYIKGDKQKTFGCIFTCTATRLVHLEIVPDLSTVSFLNCLKRFVARRGIPHSITCDNAPTFSLGEEIWEEAMPRWRESAEIHDFLLGHQTEWIHITPYAPWKGGFYERLVRSVKHCLYKTVGKVTLQLDTLQTIITEIEAILNSRPLTTQSESEFAPLRPIDFLQRHLQISMPLGGESDSEDHDYLPLITTKTQAEEAIKTAEEASEKFWSMWREQYLVELRAYHQSQWNKKRGAAIKPAVGQIVLVSEEVRPRNSWRMAKIVNLVKGKDGQARDAEIKIGQTGNMVTKPVNLLIPLELTSSEQQSEPPEEAKQETQPVEEQKQNSENRYGLRRIKNVDYRRLHEGIVNCVNTLASFRGCSKVWLAICISLSLCNITSAQSNNTELEPNKYNLKATARCTPGGVETLFMNVQEYSICSAEFCFTSHTAPSHEIIKFPPEIVMFPFKVHFKVGNQVNQRHFDLNCPAMDFCEAIDCTICLDHIFNPFCWPLAATFGYCVLLFLVIFGGYAFFKLPVILGTPIIVMFHVMLRMIKISTRILFAAINACIKIRVKVQRRVNRQDPGSKEERKEDEVQAFLETVRKAKKSNTDKGIWLAAIAILTLVGPTNGCQDINLQGTHNMICKETAGNRSCSIELTEVLKLNTHHRTACLIGRVNSTKIMEIRLQWEELELHCLPSITHYTRDVVTGAEVLDCQEYCIEDPSFEDSGNLPEHLVFQSCIPTVCEDGLRKWLRSAVGDLVKTKSLAMMDRRTLKVWPSSEDVFTLKQCDKWNARVHLNVTRFEANGTAKTEHIILFPNVPVKRESFSLTLSMLNHPIHKAMSYEFVSNNNNETAIWPPAMSKPIIACDSLEEAMKFTGCKLSGCPEMKDCSQVSLQGPFQHAEWNLPTVIAGAELEERDEEIVLTMNQAVMSEITIRFHTQIADTITQVTEDTCSASDVNITGCYNCPQGGSFEVNCTSNSLQVVGELKCGQDNFAIPCRPGGESTTLTIFRNSPTVNESCTLRCGIEQDELRVTGQLRYLPPRWTAIKDAIWKDGKLQPIWHKGRNQTTDNADSESDWEGSEPDSGDSGDGWLTSIVKGIIRDMTAPFVEFIFENKVIILIGFMITILIAMIVVPLAIQGPAVALEWGLQLTRVILKYSIKLAFSTVKCFLTLIGQSIIYTVRFFGYLRRLRSEVRRSKTHIA